MRLLLGIPTSGAPAQPFLESLTHLRIPRAITQFDRIIVTGNYVPAQRELIARRALETEAAFLLMCDDDMIVPPDALEKLLDALTNDSSCGLAGALYYSRDGFRPMVVDAWNPADTTTATIPAFADAPVCVAGVGFGCVLVRVASFASLARPFFDAHVFIEESPPRVRVCDEDYLFCHRLSGAGHRIVLHGGVRCGHYDRSSGITQPVRWERPEETNVTRMAVIEDGTQKLVPLREASSMPERHERVEIDYVWSR